MTKQKIIDYIRNIEDFDIGVHDDLIQMIKDLKPKVKKLIWSYNERQHCWQANKDMFLYEAEKCDDASVASWRGYIKDCKTLEQAQEACQKHYEQSILESLEE